MATLTVPAIAPFSAATVRGSAAETTRVRLLSIAQARHAPATSSAGAPTARPPPSCKTSVAAPAAMASIPTAIRTGTCSRNTTAASRAVKRPSRLSSSADSAAPPRASADISKTGPITPPVTMAPTSHGTSRRPNDASGDRRPASLCKTRNSPSPAPEPRYRSPASSQGSTRPTSSLAEGALRPKRAAAASANRGDAEIDVTLLP